MVQIKTNETILGELRTFLKAYSRLINTGDTSLIKDFILTPLSVAGEVLFTQISTVKDLFILSQQSSSDLDIEATNYKLERSTGTAATVTMTFYTESAPTEDVVIPQGTVVSTVGTTFTAAVRFVVASDYTFPLSAIGNYYSYDRARYEFNVFCSAESVGSAGNVGSETIINPVSTITGITGVTNLSASSGGGDQESDESIRRRIQLTKAGRDLNTANGLQTYIASLNFASAKPIRVEDSTAERATGIDIFVIDSYVLSQSDTFTYRAATSRYYLSKPPVRAISQIISSSTGVIAATDYGTNIDNSSSLRRSAYASDYVTIYSSAGLADGDTITVTYTYSADVSQTQDTLELDSNNVLTAEVYLKRAFPLYLRLNASLTLKSNADGPTVRSRVRNGLVQFLSTYNLGDDIQKSDLIVVLQEGYGDYPTNSVDAVIINSYYLEDEFGTTYTAVDETISVTNKQYVVYGSTVLT